MKKRLFFSFIIFFLSGYIFSQVSVSPENEFYKDVINWQLDGIIYQVPQVKPFPVNVIKSILNKVKESGSEFNIERVKYYEEQFFQKKWKAQIGFNFDEILKSIQNGATSNNESYNLSVYSSGDFDLNKFWGLSYNVGLNGYNLIEENIQKYGIYDLKRTLIDNFSVKNDDFVLNFDINALASFGTETNYLTFGLNKLSFGPFAESSISLNNQSYQSLNLNYNYLNKYISFSQILAAVSAVDNFEKNKFAFDKFFAFHSLKIPLFSKNVHLSYYETSIFAKSFMPYYVLPVPYVVMANVSGFNENIFSGFLLEYKIVDGLKFNLNLNIDNLDIKQILKLKFDSGLRTAVQIGFEYAPKDSICNLITLDYSLATPFTYSYFDNQEDYSYRSFTNMGIPLAMGMDPNSDRISFKIDFKSNKNLKVSTKTIFIRHANIYESLASDKVLALKGNKYNSDGSFLASDFGLDDFTNFTNFLTQDNKMYIIQGTFDFEYFLKIHKTQRLSLNFSYFFEFIKNDGVNKNIYSGLEETKEDVEQSIKNWESGFKDRYNHYFSIGIKYIF